jgi:hypothetical protein
MPVRLARTISALLATTIALGIYLVAAIPVVACSCIGPQPMSAYAGDSNQVIFAGFVQAPDGRGVPVRVSHWFQGPEASASVWLARDGFEGNGASCGTALPPAGTQWIFVAYRTDGRELGVNLCTPHAAASAAEGQAMFRDAVATFGQGVVIDPEPSPATPAEPSPATPASTGHSALSAVTGDSALPMPVLIGALGIAFLGIVAGWAFIARRRRDPADMGRGG